MFLNSAVITSFLLASTALAYRQPEYLNRAEKRTDAASDGITYDNDWAGAVWNKGNGAFKTITGTFTVPAVSGPVNSAASAWVGFDGKTCNDLFRAGVDFVYLENKSAYQAWYKWEAGIQHPLINFDISTGDVIKVTVTADSATSGTATIENTTKGKTQSKHVQDVFTLCRSEAEWVVEDYTQTGNLNFQTFAQFGEVTFTNAEAQGSAGHYTPEGATVYDVKRNGKTLTSVSLDGSSVTIKNA